MQKSQSGMSLRLLVVSTVPGWYSLRLLVVFTATGVVFAVTEVISIVLGDGIHSTRLTLTKVRLHPVIPSTIGTLHTGIFNGKISQGGISSSNRFQVAVH